MKEQMKRTVYEAPETRLFRIEMEGNFCGSAEVKNPKGEFGEIAPQDVNTDFSADFGSAGWDATVE
ncbi:MAG: hypothetical protein IJ271_05730 [Bacteroidales bacterium]|nr:hypothetical protein [Bacteroidales bacterium]